MNMHIFKTIVALLLLEGLPPIWLFIIAFAAMRRLSEWPSCLCRQLWLHNFRKTETKKNITVVCLYVVLQKICTFGHDHHTCRQLPIKPQSLQHQSAQILLMYFNFLAEHQVRNSNTGNCCDNTQKYWLSWDTRKGELLASYTLPWASQRHMVDLCVK